MRQSSLLDRPLPIERMTLDDKRDYLALLERREAIARDREKAEKEERARRDHVEMMEAVAADAEKVRKACESFAGFVEYAWKVIEPGTKLKWNWHLQAMCDHLEAISKGTLHPRLIINVPPGSSKSTIVSVLWQAWEWGPQGRRHLRYVTTSFELGNVKRDTGKTRDLIMSEWYQALWPEVEMKNTGVLSFSNTDTGTRVGVAFHSVMGKRGDRLVVDDPHSLKGAESETVRSATIQLFIEGGLNRTNDAMTSAIVIVMQRVHADDLTGALLAKPFGFIHLMIPMEFEPARKCVTPLKVATPEGEKVDWTDPRSYVGELMDPERVPPEAIAVQKLAGEYAWNGQYQQRPAPREGGMFKVDNIPKISVPVAGGVVVRGWDIAASVGPNAAWTVGVRMRRVGPLTIIEDVVRIQGSPHAVNELILKTATEDGPLVKQTLPQDPGAAGKTVKWAWAELLADFDFEVTPETGDKVTRATPFSAQVEAGVVQMMLADWNSEYIEELRLFPASKFKDQVDASSRAYSKLIRPRVLAVNAGPEVITEEEAMVVDGVYGELVDDDDPWAGV